MAQLVTAKNFLVSYDPSTPTDSEGKKYRGTAHEFQDYAYRLASDLNDRDHLHIYMRYAKQYPRYLLEEVYASIADIDERNKGKLFMWKFKQVREDLRLQRSLQDFSRDSIYKRMMQFQNDLYKSILKKAENFEENEVAKVVSMNNFDWIEPKSKILFIDTFSSMLLSAFSTKNIRVNSVNIAKNITNHFKDTYAKSTKIKSITKDFHKNKYKELMFNLIIIDNGWLHIPNENEMDFLREVKRIMNPTGKVILKYKQTDGDSIQKWKSIQVYGEDKHYFDKENNFIELRDSILSAGFKIENDFSLKKYSFMILSIS